MSETLMVFSKWAFSMASADTGEWNPDLDRAPLRTYLVLSENRVLAEIEAIHAKIAEKQRQLIPLEGELYEVRKAKRSPSP